MGRTTSQPRKKVAHKVKTRAYDTTNYLRNEQDMAVYLIAALMGSDAAVWFIT